MRAHSAACFLAAFLLAAIPGTAQTSVGVTGQGLTGAASTKGALTDGATLPEEDTTTYAADFEKDTAESLTIVDNASLSLGADTAWTLTLWYRPESLGAVQIPVVKNVGAGAASTEYMIYFEPGANRFYAALADGVAFGQAACNTLGAPSVDTWYFIVAVHDPVGNTIGCSGNGGAIDTAVWANGTQDGAGVFQVGKRAAAQYADGAMAYLGFWKGRALAVGELAAFHSSGPNLLYADLTAGQKTSVEAWWDFEEVEGAQRDDSHGINHLTDNNTVGQAEVIYP